jgi:hypothetical protein
MISGMLLFSECSIDSDNTIIKSLFWDTEQFFLIIVSEKSIISYYYPVKGILTNN